MELFYTAGKKEHRTNENNKFTNKWSTMRKKNIHRKRCDFSLEFFSNPELIFSSPYTNLRNVAFLKIFLSDGCSNIKEYRWLGCVRWCCVECTVLVYVLRTYEDLRKGVRKPYLLSFHVWCCVESLLVAFGHFLLSSVFIFHIFTRLFEQEALLLFSQHVCSFCFYKW